MPTARKFYEMRDDECEECAVLLFLLEKVLAAPRFLMDNHIHPGKSHIYEEVHRTEDRRACIIRSIEGLWGRADAVAATPSCRCEYVEE